MKIYTRTGDQGTTSLVGGKRVDKDSPRLEAYGTVDELNSFMGVLAASVKELNHPDAATMAREIEALQNKLFNLGAYLATETDASHPAPPQGIDMQLIQTIEQEIDRMEAALPPLHAFILPGGCAASANANVARSVCRRAERRVIALKSCADIADEAVAFLNRLSDYLFSVGRYLNHISGVADREWEK